MKRKTALAIIIAIITMFTFTACGNNDETDSLKQAENSSVQTLESYFKENPDVKEDTFKALSEQTTDSIKIDYEIKGNDIEIIATYTETFPEEVFPSAREAFNSKADSLRAVVQPIKTIAESMTGVPAEKITCTYTFCNGDGTEIWSKTF